MAALTGFKLDRVLSEDARSKTVAVVGRFKELPGQAVVLLSKQPFQLDGLSEVLSGATQTTEQFKNDIYSKLTGVVPIQEAAINIDITYPATEKHIQKASAQEYFLVRETPEDYAEVTLPYVQSIPRERIQWVYNILEKKAEADRIIFEDPDHRTGFLLLPDLKWDQQQIQGLYCVAIVMRRDVLSLRDLRAEHLPLLRNIRRKASQALEDKYGVSANQIRMWVHYQPSYYHFHVHIAHTKWDGAGLQCGKAALLDDVIDNLSLCGTDYYARRTMTYTLGENDPLLSAFGAQS